jgi:hypothetical protein
MFALPTVPTTRQFNMAKRNILATYDASSHEQRGHGAVWYPDANALARELDSNATRAAGVIAALSANKSWRENVKLAHAAYDGDHIGHVGNAVSKARAILAGMSPENVLPMSKKTGNFYLCIAWPDHPTAVCIDRHAHDVAAGCVLGETDRGLGSLKRYAWIADAYRAAGDVLGVIPSVVQATTWVAWRARLTGTRGRAYDRG